MSACRVCGSAEIEPLVETGQVPVQCTALYPDATSARLAPSGPMRLVLCRRCTAVTNAAFDPGLVVYDAEYENSQMFSGTFRAFANDLAARLVADHDLGGGHVVEVGSGKGEFLTMLIDAGLARATGYDPTYGGEVDELGGAELRIVRAPFDESTVGDPPDLVCLRHVLEHLEDPVAVLRSVRHAISANRACALYVEVPNAAFTFTESGLWDIIYQHCTYFSASSLEASVRASGFEHPKVQRVFGGQFLAAEAHPARSAAPGWPGAEPTEDLLDRRRAFGALHRETMAVWRDRLHHWAKEGRSVALWGAGAKGVTFLNLVGADAVSTVVDVNARKRGRFLPGTGHLVMAPEDLHADPPDIVIMMNARYAEEITRSLHELGLDPVVVSV